MAVRGIENMTAEQVAAEVKIGARFVVFQYCISIVVMTFKRSSDVYFIRPGEGTLSKSVPFTLCSLFLGWWGIPWGPIWTITTIVKNLSGGRDVTNLVLRPASPPAPGVQGSTPSA
jgi:hypothetical protein